jgi:hypothetical protein
VHHGKIGSPTSPLGQKQTSAHVGGMFALPTKADIGTGRRITFDAPTPAAIFAAIRRASSARKQPRAMSALPPKADID